FCPTVAWQTRCGRGLEFACVDAIPFFFWALSRALRDGKLRDAALAALCLTWVWTCNYYYFLICALLIPLAYVSLRRPVSLGLERRPARGLALKALDAALLAALAWAVHAAFWTGQRAFHGRGSARTLLMYLLPYLCLWGLAALRLAAAYSARWRFNREAARWPALKPYAATLGLWLALNLPMVVAVLYLMSTGDYATAPRAWRGGGDPVDPLWLAIPSLYHPFWSGWILRWIKRLPFGKPIWTSLGLTPLAAAAWLWPRRPRGEQWVGLWFAGASVCSVLVLGPWLRLFGVDTYLPLPFYFLHLLPVLNNMANGTNFAIFAALFLALLFAVALTEMMRRLTPRRARWVPAAAFALVALEFAPGRLPNFRLDVPPLIRRFAGRPRGAFLPVPLAEHFPRLMYGMAGTEWLEMTTQMVDARPRVGGFLPRVSERVYRQAMGDPFFKALLAAQGGAAPAGALT
ncbi:MAG: hypothetical protein KGK30_08900, partial [Elusimicrobia bacterium]|nr:hypothetical protein [Elusimicrobiota bacterium]